MGWYQYIIITTTIMFRIVLSYLVPDDDLWISDFLVDVGVSRTKLGCTVLSTASWIVPYRHY